MRDDLRHFVQFIEIVNTELKGLLAVDGHPTLIAGPLTMFTDRLKWCHALVTRHDFAQARGVTVRLFTSALVLEKSAISLLLDELIKAFVSDMWDRSVFVFGREKAGLFESGFSNAVDRAFPDALPELREANSCFALERYTACVFHSMRGVEHGARALLVAVGGSSNSIPLDYLTWNTVIEQINSKWKSIESAWGQSPELTNAREFFHRTVSDLYAFKDAVRNTTMHTRHSYGEHDAQSELNRTREWFERLATKVHQGMSPGAVLDKNFFAP